MLLDLKQRRAHRRAAMAIARDVEDAAAQPAKEVVMMLAGHFVVRGFAGHRDDIHQAFRLEGVEDAIDGDL